MPLLETSAPRPPLLLTAAGESLRLSFAMPALACILYSHFFGVYMPSRSRANLPPPCRAINTYIRNCLHTHTCMHASCMHNINSRSNHAHTQGAKCPFRLPWRAGRARGLAARSRRLHATATASCIASVKVLCILSCASNRIDTQPYTSAYRESHDRLTFPLAPFHALPSETKTETTPDFILMRTQKQMQMH